MTGAIHTSAARRELWGWSALAIAALAIAGVYAAVMILSRAPNAEQSFPWLLGFFRKGLVIHVVFSVVVWFFAVMGGLFHLAAARAAGEKPRADALGWLGLALATASLPLLFVPAFLERAEASLNNYVPVLMHPLYYAGLGVLALGISLPAVRLLANTRLANAHDAWSAVVARAAVVFLAAIACVGIAWWLLGETALSEGYNEMLFWGGGHLLQFANTILLMAAWYLLGQAAFERPLVGDLTLHISTWVLMVTAMFAPAFYLVFDAFSQAQHQAFTSLQLGFAPWTVLVAGASVAAMRHVRALPWRSPAFHALLLSFAVFGLGGAFAFFADGRDTRTPAHYHGMIGGVTIAFMGIFYSTFLPALDRKVRATNVVIAQLYLYAGGQAFSCIGLFIAAAPRKTAGAEQLTTVAHGIGMHLNRSGGGLAILGGMLFVGVVSVALLRPRRES